MPVPASRLDRLLALMEGGNSKSIRKSAALQVASYVYSKPSQLYHIIVKVWRILQSRSWEARVAAGACLGYLVEYVQHHTVADILAAAGMDSKQKDLCLNVHTYAAIQDFDIARVLEEGDVLLQSAGQEFEVEPKAFKSAASYESQRKALRSRMKMGANMEELLELDDIIEKDDLIATPSEKPMSSQEEHAGLSAREKNQRKRQVKQAKKPKELPNKRQKTSNPGNSAWASGQVDAEHEWQKICNGHWPFDCLANQLLEDCFEPAWEARHGSLLALREILRFHASSAAVSSPVAAGPSGWSAAGGQGKMKLEPCSAAYAESTASANSQWIERSILKLMTVLVLDRFGDYISDQVIAPVRETAAQVLGLASRGLPPKAISHIVSRLCELQEQKIWPIRHGGLLGLKYVLAAHAGVAETLLPMALPAATAGLQDPEDDVRAVAAESLVSVTDAISQTDHLTLTKLLTTLWNVLLSIEDLSLSTGSVLQLLALLYRYKSALNATENLRELLPRLWPFFQHTLTRVRAATALCLASILTTSQQATEVLSLPILKRLLAITFKSIANETNDEILKTCEEIWICLLQKADSAGLLLSLPYETIQGMFELASAAVHLPAMSDRPESADLSQNLRFTCAPRGMFRAGQALGKLASRIPQGGLSSIMSCIVSCLASQAAAARQLAALVVHSWAMESTLLLPGVPPADRGIANPVPADIQQALLESVSLPKAVRPEKGKLQIYAELQSLYKRTHNAALRLLQQSESVRGNTAALLHGLLPAQYAPLLTADNAIELSKSAINSYAEEARTNLASAAETLRHAENCLHISVTAAMAAAIVQSGLSPQRMNIVIQPLMAALRRLEDSYMRTVASAALAQLLHKHRKQSSLPQAKIIGNLASLLSTGLASEVRQDSSRAQDERDQISTACDSSSVYEKQDSSTARMGGEAAFRSIAAQFGSDLFSNLPSLEGMINEGLKRDTIIEADEQAKTMQSLQILEVLGPQVSSNLWPQVARWLNQLESCFWQRQACLRQAAAKTASAIAASKPAEYLPQILRTVTRLLSGIHGEYGKEGGITLVMHLVATLQDQLVPYLFLLVVPVMRSMNDHAQNLRISAASVFSQLVALLPLAQGISPPAELGQDQLESWKGDATFLTQLLDNSQADPTPLPFRLAGMLRPYQQDGINWLAFLQRCGLHGILADDMGLGKTLQATAIIAASHVHLGKSSQPHSPSLIVCPQILVGHWPYEMQKFVGSQVLKALAYEGKPDNRLALQRTVYQFDVVVMSYETLRADIKWAENISWHYCVLDEGHLISNPKTRTSQAVKQIHAKHRLILSGTPIQNHVHELWALFDFLMPGFLGDKQSFTQRFGKAVNTAQSSRGASKQAAQDGLLAMEALHKQVMPFILRRTKDTVLSDLPPKILQDVKCQMSSIQARLYDHFSLSNACQQVESNLADVGKHRAADIAASAPHIFQALQYLRKLCSHPLLVLKPSNPSHVEIAMKATEQESWQAAEACLHELVHAPKLQALQQLLQQCDTGVTAEAEASLAHSAEVYAESGNEGHRVLVFAQFKNLLDLVELDVMRPLGITYLRLDGSVDVAQRFNIVRKYNEDPSISVMLLTTSVGGLGLNLTAADTVIFLEHDWNPMKDLQAMDRAHRLGQRRTVNVYRVLIENSLEDRIMSLQRFKIDTANAIVNQENVSLKTMDTSLLIEGLHRQSDQGNQPKDRISKSAHIGNAECMPQRVGNVLENLGTLWDESEYIEEFSLDKFVSQLP